MTITAPAPISTTAAPLRLPAWLLALSPLGYVAAIGLAFPIVLILMPGLVLLDDITRTQMDHFATGWVLLNVAQLLSGVGVVGLLLVGLRITGRGRPWGLAAVVLAGLALVGLVVGVGLRIAATGFTSDRLADDGRYAVGTWLAASMVLPMLSTVLLCIALRLSGRLRISALIIAGIAALLAILDLVSYSIALVFPPVLATVVTWLPIGILLLRRPRGERRRVGAAEAA